LGVSFAAAAAAVEGGIGLSPLALLPDEADVTIPTSSGAGISTVFRVVAVDNAGDGDVTVLFEGGRTTGDGDLTFVFVLFGLTIGDTLLFVIDTRGESLKMFAKFGLTGCC